MKTLVLQIDPQQPDESLIEQAAQLLREGKLVAFPTETVYGLGANAFDSEAVGKIFTAKGRPASDPIIVHLHDLKQLESIAINVPQIAYDLAERFWPGALTFVLKRGMRIPANVSAGMDTVAVRMPSHLVAQALLKASDLPVAAPSANRFARPSATTAQDALEDLDGRIDAILDGGATTIGLESTILDLTKATPAILRPGGVPVEAIRAIIPNVEVVSKHLKPDEAGIEAPGMLLKHYSPRAELLLFDGMPDNSLKAMHERASQLVSESKSVGVLTTDDEQEAFSDLSLKVIVLGRDIEAFSHNLFTGMRELDRLKVDVILVRGYERTGLGTALWDRLVRAAEGHVIDV